MAMACFALAGCSPADTPDAAKISATPDTGTSAVIAEGHFHPKGKAPSEYTLAIFEEARQTLPFSDRQDFEEQSRGFIAGREDLQIMADAGNVAWDMEQYEFLNHPENINSVHPSLLRMGQLNMNYGLYEVIPGIYQVRGFDLTQITFVKGETGWIVFDPLTTLETARAAKELVDEHLEVLPVVAVVYSHSHVDHYGGVRGLVTEEDVASGKVEIIAPRDFMEFAVAEAVYAGNAMSRRSFFQYGVLLNPSPYGHAGQGLGQNVGKGNVGLIRPTRVVEDAVETFEVDGIEMVFQNTPDTEAPSEMNTYIPSMKTLWMAENVVASVHNIYTLRGAQVRDSLRWSKYINEALYAYGQEAEVMIASHHWPRWGNERIQEVLKANRDIYAHMNNQVLHYANQGVTINEIHNVYRAPKSLQDGWITRFYHGSQENNSRGVINKYLGHWDTNPATLIPLSPRDSAPLYVEMMGGSGKIMAKGRGLHNAGKYRHAVEILDRLVFAEPDNQAAKDLLADVYEQLGYQQENPGLRNSFLSGAYELRSGIPEGAPLKSASPDTIRAMTTGQFIDFLGIRMDSTKAEDFEFTINLITPDNGEKYLVELRNATLTNIEGYQADDADLTITINRSDLEPVMMGEKTFMAQVEDGTAQTEGNLDVLQQLASAMIDFDLFFEVLPGTKGPSSAPDLNDFEVGSASNSHE
jgi:alkyl sulfatase BDS1-like metallo-beta-lactamase superfamily hydrolase